MIAQLRLSSLLATVSAVLLFAPIGSTQTLPSQPETRSNSATALRIDPLLLAEAGEVWRLIASPNNPVWPVWDASTTPLMFYLPGEQDVLVNHPHPPQGFLPYDGPVQFPAGHIFIKNGPTVVSIDGQNTAMDVADVRTLVVADTLSNLRNKVSGMLQDPRPATEKVHTLEFSNLATSPYDQMATIVHEAFHVFQDKQAPDKGADDTLLLYYPVLAVKNNVGFALEGVALADALRAKTDAEFRRAAVRWLAVRKDRRASLPERGAEYEDGVEFTEGLATYVEYRLFKVLEGSTPAPVMAFAQGFSGYGDLSPQRQQLIDTMIRNMSGAVAVNNEPYGTAPLRMRLYYSGMAEGVLLDRLSPDWKTRIFEPAPSLTSLAEDALKASQAELENALKEARASESYDALVESKTRLAEEGRAGAAARAKEIESGPGIALIVDYSALDGVKVGMGFTPFGITVVDNDRTIFTQVPIKVIWGQHGELTQTIAAPLLRDTKRKLVRFRLPASTGRGEVEKGLGSASNGGTVANLMLDLPGATLKAAKAEVKWQGQDLIVALNN